MNSPVEQLGDMARERMQYAPDEEMRKLVLTEFVLRARAVITRGHSNESQNEKETALEGVRVRVAELCELHSLGPAVTQSLLSRLANGTPANNTSRENTEVVPKSGRRERFEVMGPVTSTYHSFLQSVEKV